MPDEEKNLEILLVEDDLGSARLTEIAITKSISNSNLTIVRDGADALSLLRREGKYEEAPYPDLVLLDIRLPKVSGYEVLRTIKLDPMLKDIPVIILTFSVYQEDMRHCYDLAATGYITKPIDIPQFKAMLSSIEGLNLTHVAAEQV